jgi:hypothetical protein
MDLDVAAVLEQMVAAAKGSLARDWPKAKAFARPELERLARSLADIARLVRAGEVNEQQARALLQIHRNTTQTVLLTIEGLGLIAVENAVNAALGAARDAVNAAAGLALL